MLYDVQINDRGQITIPKELRETVNLKAHDRLKLSINTDGRIILYKSDFFDDVEDLIRKDLKNEGLTAEQIEKDLPGRKKELGKALLKMASEVDQEIERGEYITLDQLNEALEGED
ncbi:AbrB/MazE/SpoVT family DNA-binding domain-containing protein [Bacillus sp. REN16]|uniref:AbrB/MazE/SpoVT family DNA-binding domain-containing protein n=1 Tax=Bacillus sp. REN16 TaxID=2887296 RepID=UPI001E3D9A2E|nr:AbrB/MazE/SpoVT family DNA-binding domain-containing protein [Bacillus sp. REN16]MCC3358203.1 AbrB/MazE/SpoVT family DNA-binding domain-containing protein [Bacillus sp. REN16]